MYIYLEENQVTGYAEILAKPIVDKEVEVPDDMWERPTIKDKNGNEVPDEKAKQPMVKKTIQVEVEHEETDTFKIVENVPKDFKENFQEYSYVNGKLKKTGKSQEVLSQELKTAKEEKIKGLEIHKALKVGEYIFSTARQDILKYKEAVDADEALEEDNVKLFTYSGIAEFTIAEAREVLKELFRKAKTDYWRKREFLNKVEEAKDIKDLEKIVLK